jgi:hypothetical protein
MTVFSMCRSTPVWAYILLTARLNAMPTSRDGFCHVGYGSRD